MTPMFSTPLTAAPWMEGCSNYVLTVVLFFILARYLFPFYACSISLRKLLGLVPSLKSCLGVIISYTQWHLSCLDPSRVHHASPMADDGDDDYLSDKFLAVAEPQKSKTYSEKRKEALRESRLRYQQNRTKSKKQLELESREDGLSKSLFERAEDDKASGRGPENKALSMMMKMGFKPGQALGVPTDVGGTATIRDTTPNRETSVVQPPKYERQLVNPLPLNEWSGTLRSHWGDPILPFCFPLLSPVTVY